jgi:hypothetical protein
MPAFSLVDCAAYVNGYDFTGDSNQITLSAESDDKDTTTFGSAGWRERIGGLKDVGLDLSGFWGSAPDAEGFPDLGGIARAFIVSPDEVNGNTAYMGQVGKWAYEQGGDVGEPAPFKLTTSNTNGRDGLVRGFLLAGRTSVSATGVAGTAFATLPATLAAQFLYGTFQVFAPAATTITAVVESAPLSNFAAPTTRFTFGPITTVGGTWATRVNGPITDTFYRLRVSAITGTWIIAGAIGIGS